MDFAIQSKIFYPSHGAGWIKNRKTINICGEEREYFEFEFINNPLSISAPVEGISNLNIRKVYDTQIIKDKIADLKKHLIMDPQVRDFNELATKLASLESQGTVDSFILIIQYCNFEKSQRIKEKRLIPSSIDRYIKESTAAIIGELAVSADITFEEAQKIYESL